MGRERSMHKEALGDFNQALATRGQTGGGWAVAFTEKKWHLAK